MPTGRWSFRRVLGWAASVSIGEWLCLLIFAIGAWQAKWVSDDGYIYLTYVQNLVDVGEGAVFNSGERVESFTSALWFVILAAAAIVVPRSILELPELVVLLGLAVSLAAVALWIPIERAARRPGGEATGRAVLNVPLAIVAGVYVFRTFATSGLETSLLLLWLGATVLAIWSRTPPLLALAALAGIAPLVRPDLGVITIALGVLLVLAIRRMRVDRRRIATMAVLFAGPLLVSSMVRLLYYAQLAPNTYYAKTDTGHGVEEGLNYLADVTSVYGLPLLLLVVLGVLAAGWPARSQDATTQDDPPIGEHLDQDDEHDQDDQLVEASEAKLEAGELAVFNRWRTERRMVLLGLMLVSASYVVWIGGDFMHGRFWITPWVFLLGAAAGAGSDAVDRLRQRIDLGPRATTAVSVAGALALTAVYLPIQSAQARQVESGSGFIDGIVDEAKFYASQNENLHDWGAPNVSEFFRRGESAAELSVLLGQEIGVAQFAIGQTAFAGQRQGDVYVYDLLGLTQLPGSRVGALPDARVGHARVAPDALVAINPRVDVWFDREIAWLPEEASFEFADRTWPLIGLDLVDDLVAAGVMTQAGAQAIDDAFVEALSGPTIDANLVTFLTLRAPADAPYADRLAELSDVDASSAWRNWLGGTSAGRGVLGSGGCPSHNIGSCLRLAIDRHQVEPFPPVIADDVRQVETADSSG